MPLPFQSCIVAAGALVEFAVIGNVERCSWVPRVIDSTRRRRHAGRMNVLMTMSTEGSGSATEQILQLA